MLELSKRKYIDPSDLIHHLGLDAALQQDAQEFSKLFLTVLEENLMQNDMSCPRNVIKEQFCGSYAYVTRCSNCQSASERLSEFYELDLNIQGHKTLDDSLKGFLQEEKLEGDNKYMCSRCNGKQNATRAIELKKLPPVLNLQLLRFVFEIKTGSKKKLSSIIQFPDILDMGAYLPGGQSAVYDLSAVLIHRGPSAYSGHYVAHIKGKDSQAWYKFNDEDIEKIKGRNLQLGNEEDIEIKQKKSVRTPKGYHSSKNAYMLVYTKRTEIASTTVDTNAADIIKHDTNSEYVEDAEDRMKLLMGDSQARTETFYNTFVSSNMLPKTEALGQNESDSNFIENQSIPKSPEKKEISPRTSPKKTETVAKSKSEILEKLYQETVELNSHSAPDCSVSALVSSTATDLIKCQHEADNSIVAMSVREAGAYTLLPDYVIEYVEKDNDAFENWVIEMNEMKNKNIATGREKQETVKSVFQDLVLGNSTDPNAFEWLPMSWLSKWLNDPNSAPAIDLVPFMCSHGKVCPDQSLKMKCVSQNGSYQLFNIYGGDIRMWGEAVLCDQCVKNKCILIRTKLNIAEDDKFIIREMKAGESGQKCYWIGKGSFRSWRRLAMERLGDTVDIGNDFESSSGTSLDDCNGTSSESIRSNSEAEVCNSGAYQSASGTRELSESEAQASVKVANGNDDEETLQFNEDLLCEAHSGLDPDVTCRRLVPEAVWQKLKQYFPGCPEFEEGTTSCEQCKSSREQENEMKMLNKQLAAAQKPALTDLFHDRKRPSHIPIGSSIFAVSTPFLSNWRQFIRDPVRNEPASVMINNSLLCKHGGYLFLLPGDNLIKSDENVTYVTVDEWKKLKEFYPPDCEIELLCLTEDDGQRMITIPEICHECLEVRLNIEESETFEYESATIYVRKHQKLNTDAVNESNERKKSETLTNDPEFESKACGNGRKRQTSGELGTNEPPEKLMKVSENGKNVRKSQRHRRVRGEKEVNVSSKDTLKDLKVQIMKLFSVPPFDQNLYVRGRKLEPDNLSTLGDLRIAPGTVIDLVADEVPGDPVVLEELHKESGIPEAGFKGTNLLSSA